MANSVTENDSTLSGQESLTEQIDLRHYFRILRKHKWPIVLFTAAVTGLAAYYAYTVTPIYNATSTLLIESQGTDGLVDFKEIVGVETQNQDYYQTQYELLRSRGLAQRVVNRLDLWNHPDYSPTAAIDEKNSEAARREMLNSEPSVLADWTQKAKSLFGSESNTIGTADFALATESVQVDLEKSAVTPFAESVSDISGGVKTDELNASQNGVANEAYLTADQLTTVARFMRNLSISPVRNTKLVEISFASRDPAFAALVANTVAEEYINSYLDAKLKLTTITTEFFNERLETLKEVLDESEQRLIAFKEINGLVDVDGSVGRLNEQELLLATTELAQARSDLSGKADLYREVQALRDQPLLLQSIPAVQADRLVQNVRIELGQAQRRIDELRNRYGERHPRVVDAASELASLNTTLDGHINRVVGSISKDYQLVRQQVASIEAKLAVGKQKIQSIGSKKFELDELSREVATNRDIYNEFFSSISEAKSADGLVSANATISDIAVPSQAPIKPKKQLIIAVAALASLILSMLMAFLYEQMDDTVKGTNDIEDKLGLRLLGILPLIKGGMFSRKQQLPLNPSQIIDNNGTFTEAVNTARTAICLDDQHTARKIIMVTSSVPGEGKSTTSINLAYSLARMERVLLIDCDLRRPVVAKAAGFDRSTVGLSDLITQSAPAHQCIKRGVFNGAVDILPSGSVVDQPLELLSSKRFEKILQKLSTHYDRIVLDCAPTQAVSDALVLSRLSDAVVYAVKSQDTSMELVKRGIERLRQVDAPIVGVLITQVDMDKIMSYGGDYYYQGYYDYYGYSKKGSDTKGPTKLSLSQEELLEIRTDESEADFDLDFGLGARPTSNRRKQDVDDFDQIDEFDLTAQIQVPQPRARQTRKMGSNVLKPRARVGKDDLDIL